MGKIKLLLLSVFFVGQLAFACGSTISGGAGHNWQGNASSPCPSDTNSSHPSVKADIGGMNYGPGYAEAMAAKKKADKEGCIRGVTAQVKTDTSECKTEVKYKAESMKLSCPISDGTLMWAFAYGGLSFSVIDVREPVYFPQYVNGVGNSGCKAAIDIAAEASSSKCETAGENAVIRHCSRYN